MSRTMAACCVLSGAVLVLPGCSGDFLCEREAIRGTLTTPLLQGEDAATDTVAGNLEAREDENAELNAVETAIEGGALGGRGVAMWLQRGLNHTLDVTLKFPTPLRAGDVLPVVETHADRQPFWGTTPTAPAGLSVGVRLDDLIATSASGSARVLEVDPLRVDLDFVAVFTSGRQAHIDGVLTVRHERWTDSCFQ